MGSMNQLSGEAIATVPEFTNRAPFALVVDALLVRVSDNAIRHHNGQHAVLLHELQNLPRDARVDDLEFAAAHVDALARQALGEHEA
jgi:hypothetical protein